MSTFIKSKKPLIISIAFACTLPLLGCDVEVEEKGELPEVDVDVDAGKLPKVDIDGPEVNVQMKEKKVKVPDVDVDVDMEEKTISVPDVDVDLPDDDEPDDDMIEEN